MYRCDQLLQALRTGQQDGALAPLYALDGTAASLDQARARAIRVVEQFRSDFPDSTQAALFSGPGRTELGGNHTDHQHGRVLCGSVDLDMLACAAPNGLKVIRIHSQGYPDLEIDLRETAPQEGERNTSAALVRGVVAGIAQLGHRVLGFDAAVTSTVLSGSGLSSSAAYEVLVANIINHFFCDGALDAIQIARIGQYAENVYFGKPCGLMDQMGSSVGGAVAIDFADPTAPVVRPIAYDFSLSGHALCIVDTGSCHADLTDDYADITREMAAIADHFGWQVLRQVPETEFRAAIPVLRADCGDRAVLRAIHFYQENRRVDQAVKALEQKDFPRFLEVLKDSGRSSYMYLQNVTPAGAVESQDMAVTLALCEHYLDGTGAYRVHGGGFAGTAQAFVPMDRLEAFQAGINAALGDGACHVLSIRPQGGVELEV
jgi:galactokinase